MAALNTPKAFDKALIPSSIREDIDPFVDYINQNFDQIIRAFSNQVTFEENFRGRAITVSAMNNTPISLDTLGQRPVNIFVSSAVGVRSTKFSVTSTGTTQLTITFDDPIPIKTRACDVTSAPFATYQIESLTNLQLGERISISGFCAKSNNGEFLVQHFTEKIVTVYNPDAVIEDKGQFTGERETAKDVSLFVLF